MIGRGIRIKEIEKERERSREREREIGNKFTVVLLTTILSFEFLTRKSSKKKKNKNDVPMASLLQHKMIYAFSHSSQMKYLSFFIGITRYIKGGYYIKKCNVLKNKKMIYLILAWGASGSLEWMEVNGIFSVLTHNTPHCHLLQQLRPSPTT